MDADDREVLFRQYVPLVYRLVRISIPSEAPPEVREDVSQEALVGLWKAVLHFEETKLPRTHMGAYARFWIRKHVLRELDRIYLTQRRESTGSLLVTGSRTEPADSPGQVDELAEVVASLPTLDRDLLIGWYGLDHERPLSVAVLAERFGLTPSKVRTRIERAQEMVVARLESRR